jgi:ABC-2 type transport system ATP-binding protein
MNLLENAVEAKDLCKSYKGISGKRSVVLKNISLEIYPDEIFGLLGPNGSGKTTLISIFSTLIWPDRGTLKVLGMDAGRYKDSIRKQINICTAKSNFPWSLNVYENLKHYAMLYGMYGSQLASTIDEVINVFELEEYREMKFEDLSTGLKQRLSLAKAMLNRPRLLFLDEPTTGLDPEIALKTRQIIRGIHREQQIPVILSTHNMHEAETLCDRLAFLRKGEIVALDTPQNLKNQLSIGEKVVVFYDGRLEPNGLDKLPGILSFEASPGKLELVINRTNENLDGIIKLFSEARILDISIKEPDMEDVFIDLAG